MMSKPGLPLSLHPAPLVHPNRHHKDSQTEQNQRLVDDLQKKIKALETSKAKLEQNLALADDEIRRQEEGFKAGTVELEQALENMKIAKDKLEEDLEQMTEAKIQGDDRLLERERRMSDEIREKNNTIKFLMQDVQDAKLERQELLDELKIKDRLKTALLELARQKIAEYEARIDQLEQELEAERSII